LDRKFSVTWQIMGLFADCCEYVQSHHLKYDTVYYHNEYPKGLTFRYDSCQFIVRVYAEDLLYVEYDAYETGPFSNCSTLESFKKFFDAFAREYSALDVMQSLSLSSNPQ